LVFDARTRLQAEKNVTDATKFYLLLVTHKSEI